MTPEEPTPATQSKPAWRSGVSLALPHIVLAVALFGIQVFYVRIFTDFFSSFLGKEHFPAAFQVVQKVSHFFSHYALLQLLVLLTALWADVLLHSFVRRRFGNLSAQVLSSCLTLALVTGILLTARGLMTPFETMVRNLNSQAAEELAKDAMPSPAVPPDSTVKMQPVPGGNAPRALAMFPDGSALVVFRGHADVDAHTRDIQFSAWRDGHWSEPRTLVSDGWHPAPILSDIGFGPALAARGNRVAAAWFTVVDGKPGIEVSLSSDAGRVWQTPLMVNEKSPNDIVAVALLRDESEVVCWQEGKRLLLRRISPQDNLGPLIPLAEFPELEAVESLQLTVLADQDENAPVQLLLSYKTDERTASSVVTLPSLKTLAEQDSACACAKVSNLPHGFALHGTVLAADAAKGTLTAQHDEIPGVMPAMKTMPFKADATAMQSLAPGTEFLARMEEREGEWWLFDVRALGATLK